MRAAACMHACTCPGSERSDDSGFIYNALIVSYDVWGGHASRDEAMMAGHLIRERAQAV